MIKAKMSEVCAEHFWVIEHLELMLPRQCLLFTRRQYVYMSINTSPNKLQAFKLWRIGTRDFFVIKTKILVSGVTESDNYLEIQKQKRSRTGNM